MSIGKQRGPHTQEVTSESSSSSAMSSPRPLQSVCVGLYDCRPFTYHSILAGWLATKIFHPNVSTAGEICVNTLKKDWKSSYGIAHILVTVKCLLIYPNPESALDEEAGKLLLENYDDYCSRAKLITSVHATPRTKPVEFNTPASSSKPVSTASATVPSISIPSASTTATSTSSTRKSPAPPSQPLQSSPANTLPASTTSSSLSSDKDSSKERMPSPSPLGTANANVAGAGTGGMGPAPTPATKAVKRSAATSGSTGVEKRKKALKRL